MTGLGKSKEKLSNLVYKNCAPRQSVMNTQPNTLER